MIKRKNISGFSLIEMSIIITVFAVLSVSILAGRENVVEAEQVENISAKLDKIEAALKFYLKANSVLPCPARRDIAYGDAGFGESVSCAPATAAAAPTGTINVGAAGDDYQLRVGAIPTRTLGLPDDYALDPWGRQFTYVIIRKLGDTTTTYASANVQATDLFQIVNRAGAVLFGSTNAQIVRYAIISHGSDGKGGFNRNGIQIACSTVAADRRNCTFSPKSVMQDSVNDSVASNDSNYYNDFVRYLAK
jgi:hypothetical protein